MKAIRSSTLQYTVKKVVPVALSGAVAMGVACLVHFLVWLIVAGPYDPVMRPATEVVFSESTVYYDLIKTSFAWRAFIHVTVGFTISGAVWAVVGLAAAAWIPDNLLAITVSVGIYFFWTYQFLVPLFGIKLPEPAVLYNDGQYWNMYYSSVMTHTFVFSQHRSSTIEG